MSTRIVIDEKALLQAYENLMDDVYLTEHHHQTNIPKGALTPQMSAALAGIGGLPESTGGRQVNHRRQGLKPIVGGGR